MSTRNLIYVFIGLIICMFIIFFSFFEYRSVPDLDLRKNYRLESKAPYNGWVFNSIIKSKYGPERVLYHYRDTIISDINDSGYLYIYFDDYIYLDDIATEELLHFLNKGNEVLIISNRISTSYDSTEIISRIDHCKMDSSIHLAFIDSSMTFSFNFYNDLLEEPKTSQWCEAKIDSSIMISSTSIIGSTPSKSTFYKERIDSVWLHRHTNPLLFTNIMAQQKDYLPHINHVLNQFESRNIILDHSEFRSVYLDNYNQSPIQFILATSSLKWAYYMTALGALLYIIFRGKRKQKPIPTIARNKNTSLEFIETLSQLHQSQNQNSKLIRQMSDIFYQRVKNVYFIDRRNPEFIKLLSNKSKVDIEDIQILIDRFDNSYNNYEFSDIQLFNLHERLTSFYKKNIS